MEKHRINTTISAKHWEILQKYAAKYETQQRALEAALDGLENDTKKNPSLSPEEQYWMRIGREIMTTGVGIIIHRELFIALLETEDLDLIEEVIANQKLGEQFGSWYFQKPINKLGLNEVIEGLIFYFKTGHLLNAISYTDYGNRYELNMIHSINIKYSKLIRICVEDIFNEYEVRTESEVYEKSLFVRVYKNMPVLVISVLIVLMCIYACPKVPYSALS